MKTKQLSIANDGRVVCVIGDVHGHLQLGLCVAARWQRELGLAFEAACLCGDVGSFSAEVQLDNATRRHAKTNPCELEFLRVWSAQPQPGCGGLEDVSGQHDGNASGRQRQLAEPPVGRPATTVFESPIPGARATVEAPGNGASRASDLALKQSGVLAPTGTQRRSAHTRGTTA